MKFFLAIFYLLLGFQSFGFEEKLFVFSNAYEFYLSESIDSSELQALQKEPFLAISLGHNCWPAAHLQDHGLRKRSFPFDWMVTSFETVYQLFETDFYGFLDIRNITFQYGLPRSTIHGGFFAHDFTYANWRSIGDEIVPLNQEAEKEYEEMLSRYQRRIARLYAVFDLEIPIYLFRWDITKDQAFKLYDLLTRKFPKSTIYLICLQDNGTGIDEDWGHPKIKHFSIGWDGKPLVPTKDRSRNSEWTRVFVSLGLLIFHWNIED